MLKATRRPGWFKISYDVAEDGRHVTVLAARDRTSFAFSAHAIPYIAVMVTRAEFALYCPRGIVANARRQSWRRWFAQTSAGTLELVRPSLLLQTWELRQDGRAIAVFEAQAHGGPLPHTATVPDYMPLHERLFLFSMVLTLWLRASPASIADQVISS
ncbi:hypothetical protein EV193_10158 [Herbihabitans rhizosphaerae]|uniref:Scramblase n=1 Tax=Herbihabitans rhizosphaerae TaxID=1872711 RepID=A0A4V2EUD4_9PSEU|nr:hypothetical protein [Herbihabitans rhizosphaerae]RZS44183.1 hypothetical protein EV193_10158 [Herbihabitans rhizosphaerae]